MKRPQYIYLILIIGMFLIIGSAFFLSQYTLNIQTSTLFASLFHRDAADDADATRGENGTGSDAQSVSPLNNEDATRDENGAESDSEASSENPIATRSISPDFGNITLVENASVDDDPFLGNPDANVSIIEFGDYQCPFCGNFSAEVLPLILDRYGDQIRITYRDFPLPSHANSRLASQAAYCSGEQEKYFAMHDLLFERQPNWSYEKDPSETFVSYAENLGLSTTNFRDCLFSEAAQSEVEHDFQDGRLYGVKRTPSFIINGVLIEGSLPFSTFQGIIEKALAFYNL